MDERHSVHSSDDEATPPAFPLALVVGGLIVIVGVIISVFIWVAADDAPPPLTSPVEHRPTADSQRRGTSNALTGVPLASRLPSAQRVTFASAHNRTNRETTSAV